MLRCAPHRYAALRTATLRFAPLGLVRPRFAAASFAARYASQRSAALRTARAARGLRLRRARSLRSLGGLRPPRSAPHCNSRRRIAPPWGRGSGPAPPRAGGAPAPPGARVAPPRPAIVCAPGPARVRPSAPRFAGPPGLFAHSACCRPAPLRRVARPLRGGAPARARPSALAPRFFARACAASLRCGLLRRSLCPPAAGPGPLCAAGSLFARPCVVRASGLSQRVATGGGPRPPSGQASRSLPPRPPAAGLRPALFRPWGPGRFCCAPAARACFALSWHFPGSVVSPLRPPPAAPAGGSGCARPVWGLRPPREGPAFRGPLARPPRGKTQAAPPLPVRFYNP